MRTEPDRWKGNGPRSVNIWPGTYGILVSGGNAAEQLCRRYDLIGLTGNLTGRVGTGFLEDSTFKNNSYEHRFTHKLAVTPSGGHPPSSTSGEGEIALTSRGPERTLCGDYAEKHKDA